MSESGRRGDGAKAGGRRDNMVNGWKRDAIVTDIGNDTNPYLP
jgi:hypothetical protein